MILVQASNRPVSSSCVSSQEGEETVWFSNLRRVIEARSGSKYDALEPGSKEVLRVTALQVVAKE